jgi:hypothetical protein
MLGLQLLVVSASARFFVPVVQHAAEAPISPRTTPRVAPGVAIASNADELILTASFSAGIAGGAVVLLAGGVVGLLCGVTFRQKEGAPVITSMLAKWPSVKAEMSPAAQKIDSSNASMFTDEEEDMEDPLRSFKQVIRELEWNRDWEWDDSEKLTQREAELLERQASLDAERDEIEAKIADIHRKLRSSASDDEATEWGLG